MEAPPPENGVPLVKRRRALVMFDGQNVIKSNFDAFGGVRSWSTDPKRLAALVADRLGVDVVEIRFYTGVPRWDRHRELREFWERKANEYRLDGIHVEVRELTYRGPEDARGREKGIDVMIALDAIQAVFAAGVDDIVLFSQDNDLREVPARARRLLELEAAKTGERREVRFHCAFPWDADEEKRAREWTEASGPRPKINYRGISGGDYHWMRITKADFAACADEREVARAAQKIDLPARLAALSQARKKPMNTDYDVLKNGGFITGTVADVVHLPNRGLVVFETTADLLAVKVCVDSLEGFDGQQGASVRARAELRAEGVFLALVGAPGK